MGTSANSFTISKVFRSSPKLVATILSLFLVYYALWSRSHIKSNLSPNSSGSSTSSKRYGIMLDAGSTGSRVHVYEFHTVNKELKLLDELFVQVKPGLSSFADDTDINSSVSSSLQSLIVQAQNRVPESEFSTTPIFMFATAGLRLLEKPKQDAILGAARATLESSGFLVGGDLGTSSGGVEIIDGKREGVYGWMTVNFLLSNFDKKSTFTTGIMDMGGASTQIVFEVPSSSDFNNINESERHEISMGGKTHYLYVRSHLGYGLMEAGKTIKGEDKGSVCVNTPATFDSCQTLVRSAMTLDAPFSMPPLPSSGEDFYAFSYFYDRFVDEMKIANNEPVKIDKLMAKAVESCGTSPNSLKSKYKSDETDYTNMCGDLTYFMTLLNDGYKFTLQDALVFAKKIKDVETAWTLGAILDIML